MKIRANYRILTGVAAIMIAFATPYSPAVFAQSNEDLAKTIANPIASMTIVPLQFYYDSNIGAREEGDRFSLNVQPLIPISINEDWNIISRTIVPLIQQNDIDTGSGSQAGLGDVLQSFFFSPKQPTENGWIWGAGPAILFPTATHDLLGSDKWGIGPTAVVLKVEDPWAYGLLVNHLASFAGDDEKTDVNASFLQPFLDYTTKDAITFELTAEATHNWESEKWAVPVLLTVTKVTEIGGQPVSVGGGIRYWAESTDSDPKGWSLNLSLTFLFP